MKKIFYNFNFLLLATLVMQVKARIRHLKPNQGKLFHESNGYRDASQYVQGEITVKLKAGCR